MLLVTFNNPEKHNAVSLDMWDSLEEMLNQCEKDPNVRVVVLNGAGGKSFVSGADIPNLKKNGLQKKLFYITILELKKFMKG